jgi:phosphinothricin acetyltransferase
MSAAIRPASAGDAAAIAAVYAPYVAQGYASFEAEPPSGAEVERHMAARPRLPWFVAEQDAAVVGFAYSALHRTRAAYRWSVDCSVYLHAAARGRGIGRALYERLVPELRDLGYVCAFAGIALPNPGSVRLHEAMGFTPVGVYRDVGFKLGRWRDVGWWQLRLCDPPAEPGEPLEWEPGASAAREPRAAGTPSGS